jgi:hypothetical protein
MSPKETSKITLARLRERVGVRVSRDSPLPHEYVVEREFS